MRKLSVKLVIVIIINFVLTAMVIGSLYVWYQTKAYTNMEISRIAHFSEELKNLKPFDKESITDYYNNASVNYRIYVFDDNYEVLFSSYELGFRKNLVERLFGDKMEKFSEDAVPFFFNGRK